jgi:hypothetical protein
MNEIITRDALSVSNSSSGRHWELDQVPAVGDPTHSVNWSMTISTQYPRELPTRLIPVVSVGPALDEECRTLSLRAPAVRTAPSLKSFACRCGMCCATPGKMTLLCSLPDAPAEEVASPIYSRATPNVVSSGFLLS